MSGHPVLHPSPVPPAVPPLRPTPAGAWPLAVSGEATGAAPEVDEDGAAGLDRRLRRLFLLGLAASLGVALLVTNSALGEGYNRPAIDRLALLGLAAIGALWAFPWHRVHRELFAVAPLGAVLLVTLLVRWSGGRSSLFIDDFFVIVVFAAHYSRRRLALLVALAASVAACALVLLGFLPYDGARPILRTLLVDGVTYLALVYLTRAMVAEVTRLSAETIARLRERERVQRALLRREQQLAHQAVHDPLTDLPNRALFLDRLDHALARVARHREQLAVLFLDLDRFKVVNDSLGHAAGDQLLVAMARRLSACLRPEDTLARLGGDEFTVLLEALPAPAAACEVAQRLLDALAAPVTLAGRELVVAASIGIACSATGQERPGDLLRDADMALYRAKAAGKARYVVFDAAMHAEALARLTLEAELRQALVRGELRVYYQPQVELATGRLAGVEALVRWQHPTRGLLAPAAFVPLAEETGLIVPLGAWVLRAACRQAQAWQARAPGAPPLLLSVNLSARQFQHPDLLAQVTAALRETGLPPAQLLLEITESVVMEEADAAVEILAQLKALGVRLAIDDFGTGYSSLAYLQRFPADFLKIDRAFVGQLGAHTGAAAIVRTVLALAEALGLAVIGEGIESAAHARHLHDLGCYLGQGYYFAAPLPETGVEALLAGGDRPRVRMTAA